MSLKHALLGLIALKPSSGYDLKQTIDRSIYFIWNVTSPQIYNTLKVLRENGFIESEKIEQESKPSKVLNTITEVGLEELKNFANSKIHNTVTRDEVLLRIFFGSFAEKEVIEDEIKVYLERIRKEREFMQMTENRIKAHPGSRHIERKFQLLSLRLKVAQYKVMEDELIRFLNNGEGS